MSFLDSLKETLQDAGWFVGAPVAAAVDLAKATTDDDPNTNFGSVLSTAFNRGTQLFFGDNAGTPDNKTDDVHNLIDRPIGKVMDGIEWLYSGPISQGINTANITEQRIIAGITGTEDNAHPWDIGSAWNRADNKTGGYGGKGTSIGRESAYTWDALLGGIFGKTASLTDEGQKQLDEHSKLFDVQSGIADAASRVFIDPTIVLGKVSKAFQLAKVVAGLKKPAEITTKLAETGDGFFAGFGARHEAAMDFIVKPRSDGASRSAGEIYSAFKGLQDTNDGNLMAQLMEQTVKDMRKTNATDSEIAQQVALISRAGMGDAEAVLQISDGASAAKDALAAARSARDELATAQKWALQYAGKGPNYLSPYDAVAGRDAVESVAQRYPEMVAQRYNFAKDVAARGRDYFSSDEFLTTANKRMTAVKANFDAAESEANRLHRTAAIFTGDTTKAGILSHAPLLAGLRQATTRGLEKRADEFSGLRKPFKPYPAQLDFVFQSSAFNYAVKITMPHIYLGYKAHQLFNSPAQPRVLEFHDPNISMGLNNFLKHSAVDHGIREGLVSEMAGAADEGAKRAVVTKAIAAAQESMVDKYKATNPRFTDETADLVKKEMSKQIAWERDRITNQVRKFTAHKNKDGRPGDVRFDDRTGLASYHALLETQLENRMILPDLKAFERVLSRHANTLTDMAAWAKGNRLPDQGRIKEIAARVFDHKIGDATVGEKVAPLPQAINVATWKTDRFIVDALSRFNTAWKFAALLRPAYPMRVLLDSDLRMLAKTGPAAFAMHVMPRAFGFGTVGGATRMRQYFAQRADDDLARALETEIEVMHDTWRGNSDSRIETVDDFLSRQRAHEPDVKYTVSADATKLVKTDSSGKRVESDLNHVYRVISSDDYARMKANGYLDSSFDEASAYDQADANQVGMFASATADKRIIASYGTAPSNVILRIRVKPGDGWVRDTVDKELDGTPLPHLSNPGKVPFSRVTAVSPRFKGDAKSAYQGDPKFTDLDGPQATEYKKASSDLALIKSRIALANTGRAGRREAYGTFGEAGQKTIKTLAGEIPGAFADEYGIMRRWQYSSETTANLIGDSNKLALRSLLSEQWVSLDNQAPNHMDSWIHAINAQLLQSELGKKALEFQMKHGDDPAKAVATLRAWAKGTPEGRKLMDRLMWTGAAEDHAAEVVGYVNHYLPTPELRSKALDHRINQADLETAYPDPLDRPPVHGQALAMSLGRGSYSAKVANDFMSRTMRWLSDAPEDQLARHPLYAAVYEQEAKRRAEYILADPRITHVTGADITKMIQNQAHAAAGHAVKQTMFDIATRSDLSEAMRFVSPFIAAWEDTVRKWGKLVADDPSILGKGYAVWNIPNGLGLVVDENGKKVDGRDGFSDNHYVLMQWPSWVPKVGGKSLDLVPGTSLNRLTHGIINADNSDFRLPKQAVNIVLQGGLQPGFGPLVAYPVGKMQTAMPQMDDVAKLVNPFGPPDGVWGALAPASLKRLSEVVNQQSKAHLQDTEQMFMAMQGQYRNDPEKFGNVPPTWEEAAKRANAMGRLKIINNFANPFPMQFDSKFQLYIDSYHALKREEADKNKQHPQGWADDQFIKKFGESFFPLVQSTTKNNAGLMASGEAVNASNKFKGLISKFGVENGAPNSTLIRLIVGPEGEGVFNQSAHRWQQSREISPGSGQNFRTNENPQEAAAQADVNLGWYKYRQFMNNLNAMANQDGLKTYADDQTLKDTRTQFMDNLKKQLPAWRVDWEQMDSGKFQRNLEGLSEIATSNKFGIDRTDMAGVREYLALRQALDQKAQAFGVKATAAEAAPLRQEFTQAVMNLVSQNTQFSEFAFNGFLERDPLLEDALVQASTPPVVDSSATGLSEWGF